MLHNKAAVKISSAHQVIKYLILTLLLRERHGASNTMSLWITYVNRLLLILRCKSMAQTVRGKQNV